MSDRERKFDISKKGIDRTIFNAEVVDLSGADILRITDDKVRIMKYEDLEGINNIDQILQPFGAVIILYETRENFGHWTALIKHGPTLLEHFDSYGLAIDDELNINNEFHLREHMGEIVPHLSNLIDQSDFKVVSNRVQLQNVLSHTQTCGRWTALRVRFRDIPLKRFIELFTSNKHYDGDLWVSALTLLV